MILTPREASFWHWLVHALRTTHPIPAKYFHVRIIDRLKRKHGTTVWRKDGGVMIYIARADTFDTKVETLVHEWAHALSGSTDHGRAWSDAYSKCYKVLERYLDKWR